MRKKLLYLSLKNNGDWEKIKNEIESNEDIKESDIENEISGFSEKYITIADDEYPDALRNSTRPPFVIYYRGDINKIKDDIYSIYFNTSTPASQMTEVRNYLTKRFDKSTKLLTVNEKHIKEITKIRKSFLDEGLIVVSPFGLSTERSLLINKLLDNSASKALVISEYPDDSYTSKKYSDSTRIMAALSKEIFMPRVFKDVESYELLCNCIDEDTKISTIEIEEEPRVANNFLLTQGAKKINRRTN